VSNVYTNIRLCVSNLKCVVVGVVGMDTRGCEPDMPLTDESGGDSG
jgi:hypothetical protein